MRYICDPCHKKETGKMCEKYSDFMARTCSVCKCVTGCVDCSCKSKTKTIKKKKKVTVEFINITKKAKTVEKTEASTVRVRLAVHDELAIINKRIDALDKEQNNLGEKLKEAEKFCDNYDKAIGENEDKINDLLVLKENLEECIQILNRK